MIVHGRDGSSKVPHRRRGQDAPDIQLPYTRLFQANPTDLVAAIVGYLGLIPGLPLPEQLYFATRLVEFVTSSDARRAGQYVLAVPVERARELLGPPLRALDPGFTALDDLLADWMTGVQFFLRRTVPVTRGHVSFADSPWAITSISQGQFWSRDLSTYGDGTVRDIISADVSNWDAPGILYGKTARQCTREQIFNEVWAQMRRSLDEDGIVLLDSDVVDRHLDPAITFGPGGTPSDNAEPLLVNTAGAWAKRPPATTRVPNLFLASDYVRTTTDLATMEGANEAARRAVNGILDLTGWTGARARLWDFEEPPVFRLSRLQDSIRYALGLPHVLADPAG